MKQSYVYFIRNVDTGLIKIGKSVNPAKRLRELMWLERNEKDEPANLEILGVTEGDRKTESNLHKQLKEHRAINEWFHPTDEVLAVIEKLAEPYEYETPAFHKVEHKEQAGRNPWRELIALTASWEPLEILTEEQYAAIRVKTSKDFDEFLKRKGLER